MKKLLFSFALLLLCSLVLGFAASAAEGSFVPGSDAVYFVSNASGNNANAGTSADAPLKTLSKANEYLRAAGGGTLVVSGEVAISSSYAPSDIGGAVVYTSVYGGVDYRTANNAKLTVSAGIAFNNDTYFDNIHLSVTASSLCFSGRCHNFGFGSGVTVTDDSGLDSFFYPVILGGYNGVGESVTLDITADYTVEVRGGTWTYASAGHRRNANAQALGSINGDVALIISGGTFNGGSTHYLSLSGMNVHTGRLYMDISGGTFNDAIVVFKRLGTVDDTTAAVTEKEYTADTVVSISGGSFAKRVRLAESNISTTALTKPLLGDTTVTVTGGSFGADFVGYGSSGSVLLKYDSNVLSADKILGYPVTTTDTSLSTSATDVGSFINPIGDKADPYVVEKDDVYYYCFSSGTTVDGVSYAGIKIAAHGNVPFGSLTTQLRSVFNASMTDIANAKSEYWAPELHYFDADTVGADNAGWYIYFAADDGDNVNHRMYVLRATDPENPLSDYEMLGQITDSTDRWAIDGTVLQLDGKLYFVWSGWEGTTNVAQNIYIAEMSNPWTISSARVCLSVPEYDWETQENPDVNEGPQILQHNGATHIIYSASGSWTQYYCYGALTLTGSDPLSASSWYKSTTPLFESGNGVYGTGHGNFVQGTNGEWWMYYHANDSLEIPEGSSWWAERDVYVKQFAFTNKTINGVTLSYPDFGTPAASGSTAEIAVRTADYHADGDHLYSPSYMTVSGSVTEYYHACLICGEREVTEVVFAEVPAFTLTSTLNSVKIAWPAIEGASGYRIYHKGPDEDAYSRLAEVDSGTLSYTEENLESGTRYRYLMHVLYTDSVGGTHYKATGGKEVYTVPLSPTITASQSEGYVVTVSVTETVSCTAYKYYRSADGAAWEQVADTADTTYSDTDIEIGGEYAYKVTAYTSGGEGAASAEVTVKVKVEALPFEESTSGTAHDAVALRADGKEFTLLTPTADSSITTALLPYKEGELPEFTYIYFAVGEYLTSKYTLTVSDNGYYMLTLPSADTDAIVFSKEPLVTYGDSNADGEINLKDMLRTLKRITNRDISLDLAAADISNDCRLSVEDILLTAKEVLKK